MNEIKGMILLVALVILCYLAGVLLCKNDEEASIGSRIAYGCMGLFALFEILALPLIMLRIKFHILFLISCIFAVVIAAVSLMFFRKEIGRDIKSILKGKINWWYLPALILIFFQILAAVGGIHIDDDDAFYLGTTTTTLRTDTMYQIDPYTGEAYAQFPMRYVLAPFPVFLAFLSKIAAMHPAILAHTIWPVFAIAFAYLVFFLIGKEFFKESAKNRGIFLFFTALISMFSYYSVYSAATFILIRSWQGKAVLAGCVLPLLFLALLEGWRRDFNKITMIRILVMEVAAALVSSMGIILAPLMIGSFGVTCWLLKREWKYVWNTIVLVFPGFALGVLYLFMRTGGM